MFLFGEIPSIYSVLGGTLIVAGMVMPNLRWKRVNS